MGMYDTVVCEYPLPGLPEEIWAKRFQTKDLECLLEEYTLRQDGTFSYNDYFNGEITIYADNIVAIGPGTYTRDGEDARRLEYRLTFQDGMLVTAEQTVNSTERAAPVALLHKLDRPLPTPEEIEEINRIQSESLVGRTMYLKYGGFDSECNAVTVIAETENEWVIKDQHGNAAIVGRFSRDTTFFDSVEDAKTYDDERKARWKAKEEAYQEAISAPR